MTSSLRLEVELDDDRRPAVEAAVRDLLEALGLNVESEGLKETPRRMAAWLMEWTGGYEAGNLDSTFASVRTDQMVVAYGIEVWSICEHHFLPFRCEVAMAYLTETHLVGLSKMARLAQRLAHLPQVQERLAEDIADGLSHMAVTDSVAVVVEGEHLCQTMRGVRTPGKMVTSVMRGEFDKDARTRAEFINLRG